MREAVAETKKVAKKDPVLGAEGVVVFLERLSPALERVDSSPGAIERRQPRDRRARPDHRAAPADAKTRTAWLERLWDAYQDDDIPYLELLGDHWGKLCASKEVASEWAEKLIGITRMAWSPDPSLGRERGGLVYSAPLFVGGRLESGFTAGWGHKVNRCRRHSSRA